MLRAVVALVSVSRRIHLVDSDLPTSDSEASRGDRAALLLPLPPLLPVWMIFRNESMRLCRERLSFDSRFFRDPDAEQTDAAGETGVEGEGECDEAMVGPPVGINRRRPFHLVASPE